MTAQNGSAEWRGSVEGGSGAVAVGDGVFEGAYSFGSRFGEEKATNLGQLIAAAHAACFTMALSSILTAAGHPPESILTDAQVYLRNIDGSPTLTRIALDSEGHLLGLDEEQFQQYAGQAKATCPVSQALGEIPEIALTATLVLQTRTAPDQERRPLAEGTMPTLRAKGATVSETAHPDDFGMGDVDSAWTSATVKTCGGSERSARRRRYAARPRRFVAAMSWRTSPDSCCVPPATAGNDNA